VTAFLFSAAKAYLLFAAMLCIISALELAWQREEPAPWSARLRFIRFGAILVAASGAFMLAFRPQVSGPIGGLAGFVLSLFLVDFLYYWMHRAQHAIPLLWRFHSVHHSVEKMGAGAGYHHITEVPLRALFVSFPLAFVLHDPSGPFVAFLVSLHGPYLHSTSRLNFGPFAWIVADNRTHRIHHSLEPKHFDRNFGGFTMIWDRLFGTACFPAKGEWPAIGLAHRREPRTIVDYLLGRERRAERPDERLTGGLADRPDPVFVAARQER
jgi:sterol desaturase/sphingolipid hydroxylase (fatty acid hydroxylase superfamily)